MNEIKELYFPKDRFVIRLRKEGNYWIWKLDDEGLKMFEDMLNEDSKNA